jgi:multiple sugar transport system permease protein
MTRTLVQNDRTAALPAAARRRGRLRPRPLPFLAPFFLAFLLFTLVPLGYSVYLSLFSRQSSGLGFGGTSQVFVGLSNYGRVLTDADFGQSLVVVLVYSLVYIPTLIGLAIVVTLLLDVAPWGRRAFQLGFYLPNIVPGLIAAIIWLYLYTPGVSPLVSLIEQMGGTWSLTSFPAAIGAVMNVTVWLHLGYNCVIFYAALQSIPEEVLEAARIDGAGQVRLAWSVKLPMIRNAIGISVLMTVVGALQLFAEPMLLRTRIPSIDSSWTPNMYIYDKALVQQDFGTAAAAAIIFAVLIGAASLAATRGRLGGGKA